MGKHAVEKEAIEYTESVIRSFGTHGIPNSISEIKEMIANGFNSGAEWQSKQLQWIKVSERLSEEDGCNLITDGVNIDVAYFFKDWGKFAKYREYPHPLYNDGVVKLYMPIPSFENI